MNKRELLEMYDLLDDTGKAIVDAYVMANLLEMLRERIEELGLGDDLEDDGGGEDK